MARFFRRQLDKTNHAVVLDSDSALAQVAGRKTDNVQMSGRSHKKAQEDSRSWFSFQSATDGLGSSRLRTKSLLGTTLETLKNSKGFDQNFF